MQKARTSNLSQVRPLKSLFPRRQHSNLPMPVASTVRRECPPAPRYGAQQCFGPWIFTYQKQELLIAHVWSSSTHASLVWNCQNFCFAKTRFIAFALQCIKFRMSKLVATIGCYPKTVVGRSLPRPKKISTYPANSRQQRGVSFLLKCAVCLLLGFQ